MHRNRDDCLLRRTVLTDMDRERGKEWETMSRARRGLSGQCFDSGLLRVDSGSMPF